MFDVAIIGAGASGTVTAIRLLEKNFKVVLIEKKDRILKKVLVTGNGQCNYTNIYATSNNYHSVLNENKKNRIIDNIFKEYSPNSVISFFKTLGIEPYVKSNGKTYPNSLQASSIVDSIRLKLESLNATIYTNEMVVGYKKKDDFYEIITNNQKISAKIVVITTGSKSYLDFLDESMYLKDFSLTSLTPAIVQLKTSKESVQGLEGIKLDVNLKLFESDKFIREDNNEILFTPYGVSGPAVFNLSVNYSLKKGHYYFIADLLPKYDKKELLYFLKNRRDTLYYLMLSDFLTGLFNKKLGQKLLKKSNIEKLNVYTYELSDENIDLLVKNIKEYRIDIEDTNGFKNCQVVAGGINLDEINLDFSSKKYENLYILGEVLDIHGDCGGYNLQYCFSAALYLADVITRKQF